MVKQRIIEEASELFGRSGVKSITMDELARHLGISKRTIYENFKDKEALLIACIDAFQKEQQAFAEKVFHEADNVADAILVMLQRGTENETYRQFNVMNDIRKYYPQVFREHLTRFHLEKKEKMEQMILRGINEGVFCDYLKPNIIACFFCGDILHSDKELEKISISDYFENIVITFLRGVCTLKGIEIIDRYRMKTAML
jgi:AcrR family transcriptional regulator